MKKKRKKDQGKKERKRNKEKKKERSDVSPKREKVKKKKIKRVSEHMVLKTRTDKELEKRLIIGFMV